MVELHQENGNIDLGISMNDGDKGVAEYSQMAEEVEEDKNKIARRDIL